MTNHIFDTSNPIPSWAENMWDMYKKLHGYFKPKIIPLTIDKVGDYSIYVRENLLYVSGIEIKGYLSDTILSAEDGGSIIYFPKKLDDSLKMYNVIYAKCL